MDAATKSLNTLNPRDIHEIRGFVQPPELVKTTMEAVCILLQAKGDATWQAAKTVLQDSGFLNSLINFHREDIPEAVLKKLKKYIDNPSFVPATVAKHSVAAMSLCMWVRAIYHFSHVFKDVEPKRAKVRDAEKALQEAKSKLAAKQEKLAEVEKQLADLK